MLNWLKSDKKSNPTPETAVPAGKPVQELPTSEKIEALPPLTAPAVEKAANGLPSPDEIRGVLQQKVRDPELGMNIVDLGLIYDIKITETRTAEVTMTLTSPGCPAGPEIITNVQRETHTAFPELDEVNIHLTWTPFWSPDLMSEEARDELGLL